LSFFINNKKNPLKSTIQKQITNKNENSQKRNGLINKIGSHAIQYPLSFFHNPLSAIRHLFSAIHSPQSALRNPQSAIRNPFSVLRIFIILSVLMLIFATSCSNKKEIDESTEYINFKVGNVWIYSVEKKVGADKPQEALEMLKITGKEDVNGVSCYILKTITQAEKGPKQYYQIDPRKGLYLKKIGYYEFSAKDKSLKYVEQLIEPPELILEFPLKVGKSWMKKIKRANLVMDTTFWVKEKEKVTTPAGEFEALKVESHGTTPAGGKFSAYQWYAKGVGRVKEIMEIEQPPPGAKTTFTTVLKKFREEKKSDK